MAEYIERDALLKDIEESVVFTVRSGKPSLEIRGANAIIDRIKSAPIADVVEVRHGEWETREVAKEFDTKEFDDVQRFSHFHKECKYFYVDVAYGGHYYCPFCGAKMDGKEGG